MAPHSSTLAWKIPWMEEPGRLYSPWGRRRVGHNLATNTFNIFNIYILIFCIKFEICEALFLEIFFLSPAFGGLYIIEPLEVALVQSLSRVWLFAAPWTAARQASLSITNSWSLLRLMSFESVMPSNHLSLCLPLLLLPSVFSSIRVFSNELALCIRWPKYWSFSFSISSSNEYSGLIYFRIDWFDLLAVKGTLKNLLQHHSSKASVLRLSAFFMVQHSHPYMNTGETIPLTIWTFVGKMMSLVFNMLYRFVIAFLPRSKCLLISWLQSLSAVILEPKKIVYHCFHFFLIYLPWGDGNRCHDLRFWMLSFKSAFSLSSFTFKKRLFSSSSLSAYRRLLIFFLAILIPVCESSSLAFLMMYSAYKLNKQGDNIQPWCTPFPIWNQSVVPCPVLTIASWHTYRFLRRQVRWSGIPIFVRIFHHLLWSTQSKALT